MIPKTIHYCWFGNNPKTELAEKCIASWKKHLPDYELIEWNETKFDVNQHPFTREAYQAKKYAFVTDYVRLYVLKEYGGIYMDTDVEVIKNLDCFLHHNAFSGFEDSIHIPTGIIGSMKNGVWVSQMQEYYNDRHFLMPDGSLDTTTNVKVMTNILTGQGFVPNDTLQDIQGNVTFYPHDFFCPKDYRTDKIKLTKNSHTIHHFAKSWKNPETTAARFIRHHPLIEKLIVCMSSLLHKCLGDRWKNLSRKIRKTLKIPD